MTRDGISERFRAGDRYRGGGAGGEGRSDAVPGQRDGRAAREFDGVEGGLSTMRAGARTISSRTATKHPRRG